MSKFCLYCAAENPDQVSHCRECGLELKPTPRQRRQGIVFLLNELESLRKRNILSGYLHGVLRRLYLDELNPSQPKQPEAAKAPPARREEPRLSSPQPVRPASVTPAPPPVSRAAAPGWLVEQQANLLLYLGAFLVVIAALIFVSYSKEAITGSIKMVLLSVYTLAFLATGVFCFRFPRVRQAGIAFFAVGALMVPLNFVGAYVFFHSNRNIDPTGLWLAGSITSFLFYAAVSMLGIGRWYPLPTMAAAVSAFVAGLVLADAPPEALPVCGLVFAALLSLPHLVKLGKASDTFAGPGFWTGQAVFPAMLVATYIAAVAAESETARFHAEVLRLWLNGSICAAVFYSASATLGRRDFGPVAAAATVAALASVLASTLVVADASAAAYPPCFVCLGALLSAPSLLKLGKVSEVFGEVAAWGAQLIVPLTLALALASSEGRNELAQMWLNVSLCASLFYVATAMLVEDDLSGFAAIAAVASVGSSLAALLNFVDAPVEAYPGSFVALAVLLSTLDMRKFGRVSEVFAEVAFYAAHFAVPVAAVTALAMVREHTATGWYLPLTGLATAFFYSTQAFLADRRKTDTEPPLTVAALALAGATVVSLVFALGLGREWFGPVVAAVAWAYLLGSEELGPKWFGQRYLTWLALIAISIAWLPFEGIYGDFPVQGAGVHFAAVALYLVASARTRVSVPLADVIALDPESSARDVKVSLAIPLVYAAGIALAIGFFDLLASLPAAKNATESDLAWPYFGLSVGLALIAATTRWFWPLVRPHVYVIALGLSLGVLLSAEHQQGLVALLLTLYTVLSLALVLWERQPLVLVLPAAYGFFALLAARRQFDVPDAYLPLALSGVGCALFAVHALLRGRYQSWSQATVGLAFAYAVAAPVAGWVRLWGLAEPTGFVGGQHFEKTLLYETAAASLAVLAFLLVGLAWSRRRIEIAAGATVLMIAALLLEVGHFRPDNVQAYTAPLGIYVLAAALLALRLRSLPEDVRDALGFGELVGALLLMAPTFFQSLHHGGWVYGIVLLVEGLALVGIAIARRRLWLLCSSTGFVVADGLHYLFFSGGPTPPNWLLLAIAGMLVMAAGTAILLGREQWTHWQASVEAWWTREAEAG